MHEDRESRFQSLHYRQGAMATFHSLLDIAVINLLRVVGGNFPNNTRCKKTKNIDTQLPNFLSTLEFRCKHYKHKLHA